MLNLIKDMRSKFWCKNYTSIWSTVDNVILTYEMGKKMKESFENDLDAVWDLINPNQSRGDIFAPVGLSLITQKR